MMIIFLIIIALHMDIVHGSKYSKLHGSCACQTIYRPVCGSDKKTHANECAMRCKDNNLYVEYKGVCNYSSNEPSIHDKILPPLNKMEGRCECAAVYKPVCASDGKTYPNDCFATCGNNYGLYVKYKGECRKEKNALHMEIESGSKYSKLSGSCACKTIYRPVCGSDKKTHANECAMKCKDNNLYVEYKGVCKYVNNEHSTNQKSLPLLMTASRCACAGVYEPVCGSDNETYPNKCFMECENENLHVVHKGECKHETAENRLSSPNINKYNCACHAIYRPVCASNNKTYPSKCIMKCERKNLYVDHEGECKHGNDGMDFWRHRREPYDCLCPALYDPVCASNDETYPNDCFLECESNGLHVQYKGKCREGKNANSLSAKKCPCKGFKPVCGSNMKSYSNECMMKCKDESLSVLYEGYCDPKNLHEGEQNGDRKKCPCKLELKPVCASNRKAYLSECRMKCDDESLSVLYEGPCKPKNFEEFEIQQEEDKKCSCRGGFQPVCASNMKSYLNDCRMKCDDESLSVLYKGFCKLKNSKDTELEQKRGKKCPCNRDLRPVCASDMKSYSNECMMKCEDRSLVVFYKGYCKKKTFKDRMIGLKGASSVEIMPTLTKLSRCLCHLDYRPVCANDGKTYPNICSMMCISKRLYVLYKGVCTPGKQARNENCLCPNVYAPVCANNTLTYLNICLMKCDDKNNVVAHYGRCEDH